jgi:FixJ family two-component response regulator
VAKQRKTIAVVDDDVSVAEALRSLLTAFGFDVELYHSAENFLLALPSSRAVALLLDVHLGDESGIDLSRRMLSGGLRIPTIFLTGARDPALRREAIELGCIAFLEKPFAARQLIEALATATGSNPIFEK